MVNVFLGAPLRYLFKVPTTSFSAARIADVAANNNFIRGKVTHDDHDNNNDAKPVNATRSKATKVEICHNRHSDDFLMLVDFHTHLTE